MDEIWTRIIKYGFNNDLNDFFNELISHVFEYLIGISLWKIWIKKLVIKVMNFSKINQGFHAKTYLNIMNLKILKEEMVYLAL